jgi:hypothetical protein
MDQLSSKNLLPESFREIDMEIETEMEIGSQGAMILFEETNQGEVFDSTHQGISRQMLCI